MSKNSCRKRKYGTWQEAEFHLLILKDQRGGMSRPERRWYYHSDCKAYHLTSQEAKT